MKVVKQHIGEIEIKTSLFSQSSILILLMNPMSGKTRLIFRVPSRGLIGYQGAFLTQTKGTGVMNRIFSNYEAHKGDFPERRTGVLIATETGTAVAFALNQKSLKIFVSPAASTIYSVFGARLSLMIIPVCREQHHH